MNRDVAERILTVALDCSRRMHALIPAIKLELDEEEYEELAKGIALASTYVLTESINPVCAQHPDLYPDNGEQGE